MSFKLDHRVFREAHLISLFRIALSFSERRVSQYGHDHLRRCAGFGEQASGGFPQAVRLAIERQSRPLDGVAHPSTETIDGEGFAVSSRNDHDVLHVIGIERFDGVPMQRDEKLTPGLLLLYPDFAFWRDVRLRHPDYIGAPLTQFEEKMKCSALFGAKRPALLELLNLVVCP